MTKRLTLLLCVGLAYAQPQIPNTTLFKDTRTAINGAFLSLSQSGAGVPSNPCSTMGAHYINTAVSPQTEYFCQASGGNWIGPFLNISNLATARTALGLGTMALLNNPMTTAADAIVGGAGGALVRLATPGDGTWCRSVSAGVTTYVTCPGAGGGLSSVGLTMPTWLAVGNSPLTVNGTIAVTAQTGQTPHQVIGTCGSATSFGPCALVIGDIPTGYSFASLVSVPAFARLDLSNTFSSGTTHDFSTTTSLRIPVSAGCTPTLTGHFCYDSTAGSYKGLVGASVKTFALTDAVWPESQITNLPADLAGKAASNASTTVNGQTCTLGSSCTISTAAFSYHTYTGSSALDLASFTDVLVTASGSNVTLTAATNPVTAGTMVTFNLCNDGTARTWTLPASFKRVGTPTLLSTCVTTVTTWDGNYQGPGSDGSPSLTNLTQDPSGALKAAKALDRAAPAVCTFSAGTLTCDLSLSNTLTYTLSANVTTLTLTNPFGSGNYTLKFTQPAGATTYTVACPGSFANCPGVDPSPSSTTVWGLDSDGAGGYSALILNSYGPNTPLGPGLGLGYGISFPYVVDTGGVTASRGVQLTANLDAGGHPKVADATTGFYGIAKYTAAAGSTVWVARAGQATGTADTGGWTVLHLLIQGTGTTDDLKDSGQTSAAAIPNTTRILGLAMSTVSAGSTGFVELRPADFGSQVVTAGVASNAITSPQMAVVNTRRVCDLAVGDTSGSAITNAQLGPQSRLCYIPAAATIVELNVAADGGTPNVIVGRNRAGTILNIVSGALATASAGGIACSNTGGTTGIDAVTTCSSTLQNTSLSAGDYLELVSGAAGGVAKLVTAHVVYTVN